MTDYAPVGGGLDFGSSFVQSSVGGVGLTSGNAFSFGGNLGSLGAEAQFGAPGPYVPSTTLGGPYSYTAPPDHTVQATDPFAFHSDALGNSDFGSSAITQPTFDVMAPDVGWIFSPGGN